MAIYVPALSRDINLVSNLEVYRMMVFICLPPLTLLSLLDSIISDFLSAIYSFSKLDCLVLWELFMDAYGFTYNRLGPVETHIRDVA
jgi:hypothetical protein